MRSILLNWLIEIQQNLKLNQRTIFLSINIFDWFLEKKRVLRSELQLVGISSFLIASKFEDIYPPEIEHIIYLCEFLYSKEQILRMEGDILFQLGFNLVFVCSFDALQVLFERHCI